MKKNLYFTVLMLVTVSISLSASTLVPTDSEPIDFTKDKPIYSPNDPRKPRLQVTSLYNTVVEGSLVDINYINLSIQNFTGDVNVEIIGVDNITTSFFCEGTTQEIVPIDTLPEGSYIIKITLQNKGTYTGYFDL